MDRRSVADHHAHLLCPGLRRVDEWPGQHSGVGPLADEHHDRYLATLGLVDGDRVRKAQVPGLFVGQDDGLSAVRFEDQRTVLGIVGHEKADGAVHEADLVGIPRLDQSVTEPEPVLECWRPGGIESLLEALVEGVDSGLPAVDRDEYLGVPDWIESQAGRDPVPDQVDHCVSHLVR